MNLVSALMGEPEKKEFLFGKSKIILRMLKQSELNEIMLRIPRVDMTMVELEKIPVLARSIISIDGVPVEMFEEVRDIMNEDNKIKSYDALEKVLGKLDANTISILYGIYSQFKEECYANKEQLKNFSADRKGEPSTESANS